MASDFGDMAHRVADLRDHLEDEHESATSDGMRDLRREVENTLRQNDSVARQVLVSGVSHSRTPERAQMVAQSVDVPNWGKYVEHGTGPRGGSTRFADDDTYTAPTSRPPIEPIYTWVVAKQLTSSTYESPRDLAVAIQRIIGEIGTFAHPFLRPSWHSSRGYRNVIAANKQAIRRALRGM